MSSPVLATKLFIPTARPELVPRSRLTKQLKAGLHRKLSLISAPAGFGKTTLITEFLNSLQGKSHPEDQIQNRIAWLSLDENDNDDARFLTYFATALNQINGTKTSIGEKALSLLQSPQPPPAETILTSLINEIAAASDKVVFVLDDYHLIEMQSIHDALGFTLENLPPQLHLVIATREDPLLPLSRLRSQGQLTELRAADLRFTSSEAAEFLNQMMGLNLSIEDIAALERRTEGWIAGLQLAAISLQGKEDVTGLIKSFSGSHRFVLDYLIEEVLDQQPENIQNFLLQTAILNRLTGSLCDALTGQEDGQQILEALERANLFIVPLDYERLWYRYHHLFADLLQQRLHQTHLEKISSLHQRASEWYEQQGLWADAIRHALAAEDPERVADLAELAWDPMNKSYQAVTWLGWVKELPDELVRSRPLLSVGCGWSSLDAGNLEAAEVYLQDAERGLEAATNANEKLEVPSKRKKVLDEEEIRALSTSVANARAYLAQALGDVPGTVTYARQAIDLLRDDDYFERGLAEILPGFAYWASGDLEAAHEAVANAVANMQLTGRTLFVISFTSYLADIMTAQGRLRDVERTYLQLLEKETEQDESEVPETAVVHLGLSELYLEQGDVEAARRHLDRSETFGELPAFAPWYRHWICAHVRNMEADGDLDGVIEMLNGAERLYYRHPIPDVRPLKALIARAWLAQGNLTEALRWVRERGISVDDELGYLREFEHLTLARLLIAQYKRGYGDVYIHDAMKLLERLLKAADEGGRLGCVIEILVLQALACESQSDIPSALLSLERALSFAEPESYVRTFVGEGAPMEALLKRVKVEDERIKEYIHKLLTSFGEKETRTSSLTPQPLIESLSERELEILQLIAEGLTNPDIASQLYLSLNTVKAHTRNIYGKLGVNSRTQAVAKVRTLGLLSSSE